MTIDDSVFAAVAARTNLYRDEARNAWRIRIPERANIALDTVVAHAHGPRRDHPALVFEDDDATVRRYSFADLDALSDRLAKGLRALGVQSGEPVAVHTGQRPETALAHLAVHKIGAVVMTLSQLYGPDTVEHCLSDSGTRIVITDPQAWSRVRDARSRFTELEHVLMVGEPAAGESADSTTAWPRRRAASNTHRPAPRIPPCSCTHPDPPDCRKDSCTAIASCMRTPRP